MTVPIQNIYYLYCYAWNRFEQAKEIEVGVENSPDLANLLAKVLCRVTRGLIGRGLYRAYLPFNDDLATVRGHINLSQTWKLQLRRKRIINCEFDELSHDVLANQIIKAALVVLDRHRSIDRQLKSDLQQVMRRMGNVSDIKPRAAHFARVQLNSNNAYYDFALKLSRLVCDCLLPEPDGHGASFADVTRDEHRMAGVFEDFVRNFYRVEQTAFSVEPLMIKWDARPLDITAGASLPLMRVDVFLRSARRKIIIDAKYYKDAVQRFYDSKTLQSANLYQIFSYIRNAASNDNDMSAVEGLLIYPTAGSSLDEVYEIQGHRVRFVTIDLNRPWGQIDCKMRSLIA